MAYSMSAYFSRLLTEAWTDYLLVAGGAVCIVILVLAVGAELFGEDDGAGQ